MDIQKQTGFNYDNCIVRTRSDEDSSSEASFSLGLSDCNDSNPQTSFHSSSSQDVSNVIPLNLSPHDCYVLMVGFLRQTEAYLNNNTAGDKEKDKLLQYSVRIREALMSNYEYFASSDNANQTTVASVSHDATASNNVINNLEKISVTTRFSSFKKVKDSSTPLPKSRYSRRSKNLDNLKTSLASVSHNDTAGNDPIDDIQGTTRRSSLRKAKKTSRPVPKAPIERNRFSLRLQNLVTFKINSANNNEHIKEAISKKRGASNSNHKPKPAKRAKYVEQDARMVRIKAILQQSMTNCHETSGSSESEATRESPRKARKARTKSKNLDLVKPGANNQVQLNGEVKRLNRTRRNNDLSKSLSTVHSEKNPRQLNGEGTSKTRNKSLPNSSNIAHRKYPQRGKRVVDNFQKTESKTTTKFQEKVSKSKDLSTVITVNTGKSQRQLSGEGTSGTRSKSLSKSLNIEAKKSPIQGRRFNITSGTSNIMATKEVNQNQSDDTGGALSTSRVVMKRKLYSAETWLQTLSESLP